MNPHSELKSVNQTIEVKHRVALAAQEHGALLERPFRILSSAPRAARMAAALRAGGWWWRDGRKIVIDKRAVAFVCERKEPGKHCIVAFKSGASGIPIAATYDDLVKWWRSMT
ncbi:MAG TPA: hypothetical protein VFP43_00730 [Mesorhizobium sp.]|nr:hypothetical protein [Mesorhizobium sp.]